MKIEQRAVPDARARLGNGNDPCRIRSGKETHGGKQLRERLESILGYGFIIESAQQQYEL